MDLSYLIYSTPDAQHRRKIMAGSDCPTSGQYRTAHATRKATCVNQTKHWNFARPYVARSTGIRHFAGKVVFLALCIYTSNHSQVRNTRRNPEWIIVSSARTVGERNLTWIPVKLFWFDRRSNRTIRAGFLVVHQKARTAKHRALTVNRFFESSDWLHQFWTIPLKKRKTDEITCFSDWCFSVIRNFVWLST